MGFNSHFYIRLVWSVRVRLDRVWQGKFHIQVRYSAAGRGKLGLGKSHNHLVSSGKTRRGMLRQGKAYIPTFRLGKAGSVEVRWIYSH